MLATLLAALKAIPQLLTLGQELVDAVKGLYAAYEKAQTDKWINEGKEIAHAIGLAKNDLERAELIRRLRDQWNNQP